MSGRAKESIIFKKRKNSWMSTVALQDSLKILLRFSIYFDNLCEKMDILNNSVSKLLRKLLSLCMD